MGLHDARVDDAVVGGGHAHVARALLHDDGEDDAGVDVGGAGHFLDGAFHEGDLFGRVVDFQGGQVHGPEGVEVEPGGGVGEGGGGTGVGLHGAGFLGLVVCLSGRSGDWWW